MFQVREKAGQATKVGAARFEEGLWLTMLVGLAGASIALLAWQSADPHPVRFAGLTMDRLGAALTLLVASVGAATFLFSRRYLEGEPGRRPFLRRLTFTVGAAYVLMLSTNLLVLFVFWSLTSLGLHKLLTHYPDRAEALKAARKKFLISRLGDLALVAVIALIWRTWGTLDLDVFLRGVSHSDDAGAAHAVALLVVLAALTKSAQFPFHSWLPETMEAPTPVSALMHAGIINAGGVLLLRFAPLLARDPVALFLLAFVGTLTAGLGMVAMWAQAKVKRTLAWSTVGQMGFMMVQCGLGAFPVAALHILGHGCYKAWSFLRSGDLPGPTSSAAPPARALALAACGTMLSIPALTLAASLTGFAPWHSPGELALSAIVALSIGQLWVALLGVPSPGGVAAARRVSVALLGTVAVAFLSCSLYRGAGLFLAPVLGDLPSPEGPLAWAAATLPVATFAALAVVHAFLPALGHTATGRAFRVHALHGFYFGAVADRVVGQVWDRFGSKGVQGA